MTRRLTALLLLLVAGAACARALPPPGGDPDVQAPRLVGTTPEPLAVIPVGSEPVVFRFDERLSERGFSEALITVSPLDGALRVNRRGNEIRVSIDGGWRPDRVYRVVVLPGVRDLFANERREAAELVFSTGPPVPNNAIAGIVLDRVTGRPAQNGVVTAVRRADEAMYMAVADTGGFYSLRHMPLGTYDVRAYSDQNRNRRRDSAEPVDSGNVTTLSSEADTLTIMFDVLSIDTTAATVTKVEVVDSLRLRVQMDDYIAPDAATSQIAVTIHALPDSTPAAESRRVVTAAAWDTLKTVLTAPPVDTTAAADTADAPARRQPARAAQPARAVMADEPRVPLPARELIVFLDGPLPPGRYVLTITGVTNLSGVAGGSGTGTFEIRPAPATVPPPGERPPPPDTTAARPPRR